MIPTPKQMEEAFVKVQNALHNFQSYERDEKKAAENKALWLRILIDSQQKFENIVNEIAKECPRESRWFSDSSDVATRTNVLEVVRKIDLEGSNSDGVRTE